MKKFKIKKIQNQINHASDYQQIYNVVKKIPNDKNIFKKLNSRYRIFYNYKTHRFFTDMSNEPTDCPYQDVKTCLDTILNRDY